MNGILSSHPGQGAIRLIVGSHGLLIVQCLLLLQRDLLTAGLWPLVAGLTGVAVLATIIAMFGDGCDHDHPWSHRDAR